MSEEQKKLTHTISQKLLNFEKEIRRMQLGISDIKQDLLVLNGNDEDIKIDLEQLKHIEAEKVSSRDVLSVRHSVSTVVAASSDATQQAKEVTNYFRKMTYCLSCESCLLLTILGVGIVNLILQIT